MKSGASFWGIVSSSQMQSYGRARASLSGPCSQEIALWTRKFLKNMSSISSRCWLGVARRGEVGLLMLGLCSSGTLWMLRQITCWARERAVFRTRRPPLLRLFDTCSIARHSYSDWGRLQPLRPNVDIWMHKLTDSNPDRSISSSRARNSANNCA